MTLGLTKIVYLSWRAQYLKLANPALPKCLKESTQTLKIQVEGNLNPFRVLLEGDPRSLSAPMPTGSRYCNTLDVLLRYPTEHWIFHFLRGTGSTPTFRLVEQLRRLRTLEISFSMIDDTKLPCVDHLPPCAKLGHLLVNQLSQLNLSALRELDLNVCSNSTFQNLIRPVSAFCTCAKTNLLLHRFRNLKSLHLRLAFVCAKIFDPRPAEGTLALEYLHIHCEKSNQCSCAPHQYRPFPHHNGNVDFYRKACQDRANQRASNIAATARYFSEAMKAPKVIRIVWRDKLSEHAYEKRILPSDIKEDVRRVFAWDVLSDEVRVLLKSEDCNNEGRIVNLDDELEYWQRRWEEQVAAAKAAAKAAALEVAAAEAATLKLMEAERNKDHWEIEEGYPRTEEESLETDDCSKADE